MSSPANSQGTRGPGTSERGRAGLLFTAFEPSGDDHAATVIAELRARHPGVPIYAWGGPRMERAGATIIERTGQKAVMGMPGVGKILEHLAINRRVDRFMRDCPLALHVPVDSPAANFPLCKVARKHGLRVVHLVAPQMWAWGAWRVKKMRRLTDLVLCLLPFEEEWFLSRGVKAKFIGHPLFDHALDLAELDRQTSGMPTGSPKLALMPGSRPAEQRSSLPILLDAYRRVRSDLPGTVGTVAATTPEVAASMKERAERCLGGWPEGLSIVAGQTDAVIRWCDFALVTSGTVTLQVAKQTKPMVSFYRPSKLWYHLAARWLVSTDLFTLPNLTAGRKIVPEFIPHFSDGEELWREVLRLLRQPDYASDQRAELEKVVRRFQGRVAASAAADAIEAAAGLVPPPVNLHDSRVAAMRETPAPVASSGAEASGQVGAPGRG